MSINPDDISLKPTHYVPAYLQNESRIKKIGAKIRPTVIPGYWHVCLKCGLHYSWCWPINEEEAQRLGLPPAPPEILICSGGCNADIVFYEFALPG